MGPNGCDRGWGGACDGTLSLRDWGVGLMILHMLGTDTLNNCTHIPNYLVVIWSRLFSVGVVEFQSWPFLWHESG